MTNPTTEHTATQAPATLFTHCQAPGCQERIPLDRLATCSYPCFCLWRANLPPHLRTGDARRAAGKRRAANGEFVMADQ